MTQNVRTTVQTLIGLAAVTIIQGCSAQRGSVPDSASAPAATDKRPCAANLTTDGSFWTGRTFKTFQEYPNAKKANAFDQVAAAVATGGWQINTTNKEVGLISASQGVILGKGETVPLNAVVRDRSGGGVRVELVFQTSVGQAVGADSLRDAFCSILEAVSNPPAEVVEEKPAPAAKKPAKAAAKTKKKAE